MLKLVKSICYHYLPKRLLVRLIRIVITETKGFVKRSISHIVFINFKKKKEKDQASTNIFRSFLGKLSKDKGYVSVEDLT